MKKRETKYKDKRMYILQNNHIFRANEDNYISTDTFSRVHAFNQKKQKPKDCIYLM